MKTLLFLLFPLFLYAEVSLKQLEQSPKGHVRNFKIWQYMDDNISSEDADAAYCLVDGFNNKIFKRYAKKTGNKIIKEQYRCSQLKGHSLLAETNSTCLNSALNLRTAMNLNKSQRNKLCKVLEKEYASKHELIYLMNSDNLVLDTLKSGAKNYLKIFNSVGSANRQKHFNVKLSEERINFLASEKGFNTAIKHIITDPKMHRMQESLLDLKPADLSALSYFFLGLNALQFKATKKAMYYFEISQKKAYFRMDKDKAVFWKYLTSNEPSYLKELTSSNDINIYTLYANEKLGTEINNYFTDQELSDNISKLNIEDPFVWEETIVKIRKSGDQELTDMLEEYSNKDDEVVHAFIYEKVHKYTKHSYIMPFENATNKLENDDKALIYALARQESHFVPSAISRSYALGVMQIMPFLIKALAKEKKENPSLDDMFDPERNITYAKKHLRYLQKYLYHPLFIAYAYNGGIGFTKRHLLKETFRKGSYEPFLSMELMGNTESREYGKKVLANYVIYKKILREEIKITSLFEILTEPSHTDRFRI